MVKSYYKLMKGSDALQNKNKHLYNTVLSAMFVALGIVLPFFTGQIREIGNMLLPMHLPVMLCGLICSWKYGLAVGAILPLLRSMMFGMPLLYPSAVAMAFECAAYGLFIGFFFERAKRKSLLCLYISMMVAMIAGRSVWGTVMLVLLGIKGELFTLSAFFAGAFVNAIPGIILQLVLIPSIMLILSRAKLVKFDKTPVKKEKNI